MRRRNAMHNSRHAGTQFLASAWLLHSPGLSGVGRVVRQFLQHVVDHKDPRCYWKRGRQATKDSAVPVALQAARKRPAAKG